MLSHPQGRVSSGPDDPEVTALEAGLARLGPAPRRAPLSQQQLAAAWARAEAEVGAGRVRLGWRVWGGGISGMDFDSCLVCLP